MKRRQLLSRGLGALAVTPAVPALLQGQLPAATSNASAAPPTGNGPPSGSATAPTKTQATTPAHPRPIPTATGAILPADMGCTSAHEHIAVRLEHSPEQRRMGLEFAIAELTKAKALGLRTVIDVGPFDDPVAAREVSRATGVNIVCCTGFYQLTPEQASWRVEEFEAKIFRDFEHGLADTGIQPGVLKVATRGLPIKPGELNSLIAAARCQRKFNVPLCIHSTHGCFEQQVILESAGADLSRCYFSHIEAQFGWQKRSVEKEIDYLQQVVAKGSTLSFNNFGNWAHTKPANMALIINEMVKRGYENQIFATMDTIWEFKAGKLLVAWEEINPGGRDRTYGYLLSSVLPWLVANGVPPATAEKFVAANPQRLFTFV